MATSQQSPASFKSNSALSAFRLVAVTANGQIGYSNATVAIPLGVTRADIPADSFATASVDLLNGDILPVAITGAPITPGISLLYGGADGYATTTGAYFIGVAVEAATENGTVISVKTSA
jgi:hypothetical protein